MLHLEPGRRRFVFEWLGTYALLLAVFWKRLWDPPYWDALTGVYTQAVWLARHHFAYGKLFHQPQYAAGGPNIQFFSLFALLFALLTKWTTPPMVFLILHLVILLCSALTISIGFRLMRTPSSMLLSVLWALVALSNPIFLGQSLSLYLEIPLATMIMITAFFVSKKRYALAAACGLLAFFIKDAALLFGLACFLFAGVMMVWTREKRVLFLLFPFPVMLFLGLNNTTNFHANADVLGYFLFFLSKSRFQYPTLSLQFFLSLGFIVALGTKKFRASSDFSPSARPEILFIGIFVGAFWASFILNTFPLPRYTVMAIVPMACLLKWLTTVQPKMSASIGVVLAFFNLANFQATLLPPIPSYRGGRSGHELERSGEYLKDLDGNRALCQELESHYFDVPIVCKWPFTQMLRIPEFGYVKRPLPHVVEAGGLSSLCGAYPLRWFLDHQKDHRSLCIYSPNNNEFEWGVSLQPTPDDKRLFLETSLSPPVTVYLRDWKETDLKVAVHHQ